MTEQVFLLLFTYCTQFFVNSYNGLLKFILLSLPYTAEAEVQGDTNGVHRSSCRLVVVGLSN